MQILSSHAPISMYLFVEVIELPISMTETSSMHNVKIKIGTLHIINAYKCFLF